MIEEINMYRTLLIAHVVDVICWSALAFALGAWIF
jgi:hypothetical protein